MSIHTGHKDDRGRDIESHTDYKINPEQAEVIRASSGLTLAWLYSHSAKAMNRDNRYSELIEKYFKNLNLETRGKGTGSWSPSAVREILKRNVTRA
jgi:hypothetical protein